MSHRELHVIAFNTHGHWSAGFAHRPEMGFGGKTAREAAQRLLHASGKFDLEAESALEIGATEGEGQLDLVIRVT